MPAVIQAGNVAGSLRDRSTNYSAHLAEIATDSTRSELRRLELFTKALRPGVVHQTDNAESVVEYACATTNFLRYSVGKKIEIISKSYIEAMTQPAKAPWKVASDKEVVRLKITTYTPSCRQPLFQPTTRSSALVGCTRSRLINPTKGASLCSDGDKYQVSTAEARLLRSAGFKAFVWCWR